MESLSFAHLPERVKQEDKMNELRSFHSLEPKGEEEKKDKAPDSKSESNVAENLSPIEKRRRLLEKRLVSSLIPPSSPLYRTIWKLAIDIAKMQVETTDKKRKEGATGPRPSAETGMHINNIAEAIQSLVSTRILLPMLRLFLSGEYRGKLQDYRRDYTELLQLEEVTPNAENDIDTSITPLNLTPKK